MAFDREDTIFNVVINHEEQYSIWPDYKEIPAGWKAVGKSGLKKDCLDYIEQVLGGDGIASRHLSLERASQ